MMPCVKVLCVNELRLTGRALGLLEEVAIIASKRDVRLICLAE